jgi:hypothetical protein
MGSQASPGLRRSVPLLGTGTRTQHTYPTNATIRRSEQELVAQNTQLNAGPRRSGGFPFSETHDSATGTPMEEQIVTSTDHKDIPMNPAFPITSDPPLTPSRSGRNSSTPTSRSASFSVPDEKSGSGRLKKIVSPSGMLTGENGGMGEEVEEEDEVEDKDFKKKRAGHYGGEAEAMKLAQVRKSFYVALTERLNTPFFAVWYRH